ncbi:type IX secretion system periplasmic lipoprotein PorW/SprE [Flavobacterium undicola]|uniref:type IX secretion system periplasmic lipoprotein PorW/SprE n=1 Tax=Flavobacterium undicola TaxID=1932779 RepID=UPI001377634E|nr:tetratricopeptide repeat protein [Flavobacterium undicola]MBA0882291.1 tetratricopeptide repeat protein [Flavobacterium undicola]
MKTNKFKYSIPLGCLCVLVACSTRNDTFLARNSHALSTKYNILYNGQKGLDKGIKSIEANNQDDFWEILPVEAMKIDEDVVADTTKNADFKLAETKATKAIQKHSMNIGGRERNSQIDEAYLLLGKSRYYDKRFIPALDAFNYILYKYPNSSRIDEAKIWREKTNMRLGNDALVIKNITKMLKETKPKKQVSADANALLASAFLNLEEKDSAIVKLKKAVNFSKRNNEKARYRFILGQLYQEMGQNDQAREYYEAVIKMNRKSDRKYMIQSQVRLAQLFDYQNGDKFAFDEKYHKLLENRENRPFLDVLNYQMAVFYDKQGKDEKALQYYNASLKKAKTDNYLIASDYRNIGNLHFKNARYPIAAKYYDSTLVKLNPKTREFIHIEKVRKNLDDVIFYEGIAVRNDSILKVVSLPETEKVAYFDGYIEKLKKADEAKKILEEKAAEKQKNIERNSKSTTADALVSNGKPVVKAPFTPPSMAGLQSENSFYFYNPSTVSFGKVAFKKNWGKRVAGGFWRLSSSTNITNAAVAQDSTAVPEQELVSDKISKEKETEPKYTADFYLKQLPVAATAIDSIAKERNDAYYQLGVIYKEKFKEYNLAAQKLEQLLVNKPEEKIVLPTWYNLYKIYQITNSEKAEAIKNKIVTQYPNSRYAQILNNSNVIIEEGSPDAVYKKLYQQYTNEEFDAVAAKIDGLINQFSGEEVVPKLELLKANTIGKQKGLAAYKAALEFVADTYPNTEEGKKAHSILADQIPQLEKMDFDFKTSNQWKILYPVALNASNDKKAIEEKISKFMSTENGQKLNLAYNSYADNEGFVIIQGITTEEYATSVANVLKENPSYKIAIPAVIISNENYKIVQIKKNLKSYLDAKK